MTYASRPETYEHIHHVQVRLLWMIADLQRRLLEHDRSKLESPEREVFDVYSPKLAQLVYGTDEYRAALREMQPALRHHYEANSHHPEHFEAGISGMSLLDLVEMLCDWDAAGLRHKDNAGLARSIEINQERFGYGDELKEILLNTVGLLTGERNSSISHRCPPNGAGLTPCCGRPPFELPRSDHLTLDDRAVTCPGRAAAASRDAPATMST